MPIVPEGPDAAPQKDNPLSRSILSAPELPESPIPKRNAIAADVLGDDRGQVADLALTHEAAALKTPEQAARVLRLEVETGLPSEFIETDLDAMEKLAADNAFSPEQFRRQSPKFSYWLSRNPNHYALAKKDLGFFSRVEKAAEAGIKTVPLQEELAGLLNIKADSGALSAADEQRLAKIRSQMSIEQRRASGEGISEYIARTTSYSGRQLASTAAAGAKGYLAGAPAGALVGTAALPGIGTLAGAKIGGTAGGISAAFVYSYNMERAFAYDALTNLKDTGGQPLDLETAKVVSKGLGIINGAIEVGSDVILARMVPGLGSLISLGKAGLVNAVKSALTKPTVKTALLSGFNKMAKASLVEGGEEVAQALSSSLGREVAQTASGQSFAEDSFTQDAADALTQGRDAAVGTFFLAGVTHGGPQFMVQMREVRRAEQAEAFYLSLGEGKDSQAFKTLPEKAQEAVLEIVKDGDFKTAYVDAPFWQQYWQSKGLDPREVAAEVNGDTKAYDEALTTGQEIPIAMERYARKIAVMPEMSAAFAPEIRRAPGEMNGREVRELFQKIGEESELMPEEEEFKPTGAESARLVAQDVVEQLKAAGVDEKTARTQAQLYEAFFRTAGASEGVDPQELYKRYGLKIRGGEQAASEAAAPQATLLQRATTAIRSFFGFGEEAVKPQAKTVTWEAIPSTSLGAAINTAAPEVKAEFSRQAVGLIRDEAGRDLLAEQLEIAEAKTEQGTGAYEGAINPNAVTVLPAETPIEKVRQYARSIQYIYRQDAVPFFKATEGGETEGAMITFSEPLSGADEEAFFEQLRQALTKSAGYTKLGNSIAVMNFEGNPGFESALLGLRNARIKTVDFFRAESEYGPVHDWGANPRGEGLKAGAAAGGPSALQDWLDSRHEEFGALLQRSTVAPSYAPMPGLNEEQRAVELRLGETLKTPEATEQYNALPGARGGRLLNVDEARFLAPEYAANKEGRTLHTLSTQRPSAAWIERRYQELLAKPATGFVRFMAGGGGSGKSFFLDQREEAGAAEIIFDGVMANFNKAVARIDAALASGRPVVISYVHRDAQAAARGVAARFDETGRWVPSQVLAEDHVNAQDTVIALAEHYKDNPGVDIEIFDNRGTPGVLTLDKLSDLRYNKSGESGAAVSRILPEIQKELQDVERKAQSAADQAGDNAGVQGGDQNLQGTRDRGSEENGGDGAAGDQLTLRQSAGEDARGRIRFGADRQFNIDLLKDANLSTFLHETGHFFLEILGDLASNPQASARLKADHAAIHKWLGVNKDGKISEAMHERFARGFEAYLMEGKAPSSELRKAFTRFKVWLTHIYRQLKSLAVELTPEVRQVFDRMLATEDEIARAQEEQSIAPLFSDPKTLLGEKDGEKYLNAVAEAQMAAEDELSAKVLGDVKREQEEWWKAERAKMRLEVEAEVNAQPVYRALAALQNKVPDTEQIRLSREGVEELIGQEGRRKLPRGITEAGALHPDIVAETFGFESGTDLLEALLGAQKADELIEETTDQRMAEAHGDLLQELDRLHDEAMKAVHNKKRSALLHRELEILADKYKSSFKGLTFKIARRPGTIEAIKSQAEGMVASKRIKDIKPIVFQRAEARAGREAIQAMLRGDFDTAFDAKQKEFLNHELYRAATAAREDIDKALDRFKRMARSDEALAKSRDIDLVNAARAVLASFGIGKMKDGKTVDSHLEQMQRYDPDMYETIRTLAAQAAGIGSYEDSTYDDFVYLKDTVDALWDLSRRTRQIMIDGKLLDREDIMEEMAARIGDLGGAKKGYERAMSDWEKAKIGLMGIASALRRVESWVDAMDGGKRDGVFRRYLWTPIAEATAAYRVDKRTYLEKYLDIVKKVEKGITKQDIPAPELGYTFSGKAELLGALLHSGNESNLSKLLRGRGWGQMIEVELPGGQIGQRLDTSRWDAFIARAQNSGLLTKEDYDYAQAVWDLLEELKPRAQKVHKEMYGYYFGEISAKAFETRWGQYRGGYVPAVADNFLAPDAAIRDEREQLEKSNNSFMFPTSGRGFTKGRQEKYAAPLVMDVRFIPAHIDKVLRFINIEPRVKDISRVVMDRGFRKTLDSFDQTVGGDMLVPWLQRAAQQRIDTPMQGFGGRLGDTIARTVRSRVGLQVMFANVVNTLQQPFDLARAFVKVDAKYMRTALWEFVRHPAELAEQVAEKSEFMSTRETARVMEVQTAIDDMMLNPTKYEKARTFAARHGYFMQSAAQNVADTITWTGAYNKAVAEGETEKAAVRFADSVVRETQGSLAPEDISRFETGTPFTRLFTMFYGYFNMQANLMGTEFLNVAREMGIKKGAGRLLYVYALGFAIPAVMSEILVRAASGDKWDEDDDGYLNDVMSIFFGSQLRTLTAMLPFVGPAINAGVNAFNNKWYDDRLSTSPAVSMIESAARAPQSVYAALEDKRKGKKAIRDSLTLLGLMSGLPVAPLARPLGYAYDASQGKARPSGPVDYARGLVTGKSGQK